MRIGQPLDTVFRIVNEETRQPVANPGGPSPARWSRRRPGEPHGPDPQGRQRAPDRRQRRSDHGRVGPSRRVRADLPRRHRAAARCNATRRASSRRPACWRRSSNPRTTPSSASRSTASSRAGTPAPSGSSATRAAEAVGRHISLVIPAERIDEEDQIIASLKAGKRIDHFETERLRSDGELFHVSLTISPIKDDAGNVVGRLQDRARHHRAQAGRSRPRELAEPRPRPVRSRPPQGRVPGDAGARAAESARSDQQRRAGAAAGRRRPRRRCSRRPRCSSARSGTWPVWSTICST